MPAYPIEPDKLLDAADRLAPASVGRGRPPYTAHRRAVSTAYYAAFHALTSRVAALVFPDADAAVRQRVRRWIAHADIATVCRWVSGLHGTGSYGVPPHIRTLLAPRGNASNIDAHTVAIADSFLELYEKRMEADYDLRLSSPGAIRGKRSTWLVMPSRAWRPRARTRPTSSSA